jgi:hypothetical protein
MIWMSEAETPEGPSTLAKGIAKENEVARNLRHQYPRAEVQKTPSTGDGGKDIILNFGDERVFYEVKNWERPLTAYDVRYYQSLHQDSEAELRIFNEGGFSKKAKSLAEASDIKLTDGREYTPPRVRRRLISIGIRGSRRLGAFARRTGRATLRRGSAVKTTLIESVFERALQLLERLSWKTAWSIAKRSKVETVVAFMIVLGPFWLLWRYWRGKYSHWDAVKFIGFIILALCGIRAWRWFSDR